MSTLRLIMACLVLLVGGCAMDAGPKAARAEPVRVLVELAVAPGAPPETGIADAQAAVIAALPATGVRVVRRYRSLPLLALEAEPSALPSILQIPQVTAVKPDRERAAMEE
jgi:hypothetical protein